jgi:hypothetical protein
MAAIGAVPDSGGDSVSSGGDAGGGVESVYIVPSIIDAATGLWVRLVIFLWR